MFNHTNTPPPIEITDKTTNGKRWYTLPDGRSYPSITTVLGHEEKPWLNEWKESLGKERAEAETERCADRGTAVHLMAERYLNNADNVMEDQEQQNIELFNQLRLQLKKIDNIRAQEVPLYSDRLKVAGRVDLVAEYDGTLAIIDFKTSTNNKKDSMVQDYFLQCTAYAIMYEELYGEFIENIVVLIAVEKGVVPLVFKRKIDDFVEPLVERINTFYEDQKQ